MPPIICPHCRQSLTPAEINRLYYEAHRERLLRNASAYYTRKFPQRKPPPQLTAEQLAAKLAAKSALRAARGESRKKYAAEYRRQNREKIKTYNRDYQRKRRTRQ